MAFLVSLAVNAVLIAALVFVNRGTDWSGERYPETDMRVASSNPNQDLQPIPRESARANTPLDPAHDVPQSIQHPESA